MNQELEEDIKHCEEVHGLTRDTAVKVLKDRGLGIGVEIGVQYGLNAEKWLENNVVERMYGIDPYHTSIYPISPLRGLDEEIYESAMQRLSRFGKRYTHIRRTSDEAIYYIKGKVDLVYVDGAKSKINAYNDITYWYPKLNDGGILCGNDYDHVSHPWVHNVITSYFPDIHAEEGDFWWVEKKPRPTGKKLSVVTPFYNTGSYVYALLENVADDDRIDDMVIIDDCSSEDEYRLLKYATEKYPKIRVFRNEENLGEFRNRIKATKLAKNDWVIFLDGDNALTKDYIDKITDLPFWREDVIYCPDYGLNKKIDYRVFSGDYIGLENLFDYVDGENRYQFNMFLGTGNYFMNRRKYLEVAVPIKEVDKDSYGDYYFSLEWLKKHKMFFLPGMNYVHRLRKESEWMKNKHTIQRKFHKTIKAMRDYKANILMEQFKPMMADREIEYIDNLIEEIRPKTCLEWGSGNSTIYFPKKHGCIQKWVSIEYSRKWFSHVNRHKDPDKVDIKIRDMNSYLDVEGSFDLILVDGEKRNECLRLAKSLLNKNGVILLHDSVRTEYDEGMALYDNKEVIFNGEPTSDTFHRGLTKLWV